MNHLRLLARRLRSRLGLVKSANVLGHGADPTGRWDSSGAFQRTIAVAGRPDFPPGIYRASKPIPLTYDD